MPEVENMRRARTAPTFEYYYFLIVIFNYLVLEMLRYFFRQRLIFENSDIQMYGPCDP